jgi:hypothetical protein
MRWSRLNSQFRPHAGLLGLLLLLVLAPAAAWADVTCTTESQMTSTQRNTLAAAARSMAMDVQHGDVQELRRQTIAPVAQDFSGIASTIQSLQPVIAKAALTVDSLYLLDASRQPAHAAQTTFTCGLPDSLMTVNLRFHDLPPGHYALVILHATGVALPQQITFVLQQSAPASWMLAGFFVRPMTMAGHDGLWYWTQARAYAQRKMLWDAWLYYQAARYLLVPVDFLDSPNLEKLNHEASEIRPEGVPGKHPLMLHAGAETYSVTALRPTDSLGPLDLSVHYQPSAAQSAALNDPVAARQQVLQAAQALLAAHPELQAAFQGFWMHADQGGSSIYALELPMTQVAPASASAAASSQPAVH